MAGNESLNGDTEALGGSERPSWQEGIAGAGDDALATANGVADSMGGGTRHGASGKAVDLGFLLDISLNVTAEIGRTRMQINELLQLNQGSIIPLDKQVGEAVDVLVNNKLMARGEVVMVNEMFAIRLTEIIGPKERIQQLT